MKNKLKPHIYKEYSLEEAAQALTDMMNRKVVGKAVVVVKKEETKPINIFPKQEKEQVSEVAIEKDGNKFIFKDLAQLKSYQGKSLGTTEWQEVTQEMVNDFARATMDFQWIHIDIERAKAESPFGSTIAHGWLTLSLSPKFIYELFEVKSSKMGINYGCNKVRFISPVPVGSMVRMSAVLKEVEETSPKSAKLTIEATFMIEGKEKPVCVAELLSLIYE